MERVYDRREFIGKYFFLNTVIAGAAALLGGCNSKQCSQEAKDANVKSHPCEDFIRGE